MDERKLLHERENMKVPNPSLRQELVHLPLMQVQREKKYSFRSPCVQGEVSQCVQQALFFFHSYTFWIMMVKGPSIWKPRAKYMTLHHPSTRAKDMGTTSPVVLVRRITMVTRIMQAYVILQRKKRQ